MKKTAKCRIAKHTQKDKTKCKTSPRAAKSIQTKLHCHKDDKAEHCSLLQESALHYGGMSPSNNVTIARNNNIAFYNTGTKNNKIKLTVILPKMPGLKESANAINVCKWQTRSVK